MKVKENNRLNKNQKDFILEKFLIGEKDKSMKQDPKDCEREMKHLKERFKLQERLSEIQIRSQFHQLKIKMKKKEKLIVESGEVSDSEEEKSMEIK